MNRPLPHLALASATLCLATLTGCTLQSNPASTSPASVDLGALQGRALGGNQPVTGATVTVYAASTSGYGVASTQLGTTTTTDGNGYFNLQSGTGYACTAGQEVYLLVTGGNTGSGINVNAGFLAILGQCPAGGGNLAQVTPFVFVNEVSTVAAAYALAGYAVDATHVADDEGVTANNTKAIAKIGMANAFANSALLENIATGVANTTAGDSSASGQTATIIVPQATINTIADILTACVNTTSTAAAPAANCTSLFGYATSDGTATGTKPTDTATAAINIAHHPAANVANLYNLIAANGAPFQPNVAAQPFDFTVSILYPQGGTGTVGLAVDGLGNAFATYGAGNVMYKITPAGVESTLAVTAPRRLAIDANNNVWVPTNSTSLATITEFPAGAATGTAFNSVDTSGNNLVSLISLTMDQNDNLWALSGGTPKKATLLPYPTTGAGNALVTVTVPTAPAGIAVSPTTGNLGVTSGATTAGALSLYSDAGAQVGATATFTGGGLYAPAGIVSDASGDFWIANNASATGTMPVVSEFDGSAGAALTAGYAITTPTDATSASTTTSATTALTSNEFDGLGNYYTGGTTTETTTPAGGTAGAAVAAGAIYVFNGAGTQIAAFVPPTAANQFFAVDPSGNLWFGGSKTIGEMIGVAGPKVTPEVVAEFPTLPAALTGGAAVVPGTGNKVATRP